MKTTMRKLIPKYTSVPHNLVFANTKGNIAFALLSGGPVRKTQKYPYVAERVLDGRVSDYDWVDTLSIDQMPFIINPLTGFFATANHRIAPENSNHDFGASTIATARGLRLTEIISNGIKEGKKFTSQDMKDMQMDLMDVFLKELTPHIVKVADSVIANY
jgi:penicillin amidase